MKIAVKFLIALGLSLLLVWVVRTFAFTVFTVPAGGLPPQLQAGNRVIVNRIDCDFFNRGEIVVMPIPWHFRSATRVSIRVAIHASSE